MWKVWPQKKSNKLCPNYKPRKPRKARAQQIPLANNLNLVATESVPPAAKKSPDQPMRRINQLKRPPAQLPMSQQSTEETSSPQPSSKLGRINLTCMWWMWGQGISNLPQKYSIHGKAWNNPLTAEEMMKISFPCHLCAQWCTLQMPTVQRGSNSTTIWLCRRRLKYWHLSHSCVCTMFWIL